MITSSLNNSLAISYAAAGVAIFPCSTAPKPSDPSKPDKAPIGRLAPKGWQSATADIATVCGWWSAAPYALIGLPCGAAGIVVIDLDRRPEVDGVAAFRELVREHGGLPHGVVIVQTISGGVHLYFSQPAEPLSNSTGNLPRGVDVRGAGGYVIAPGTRWRGGYWQETERSPKLLDALRDKSLTPPPEWLTCIIKHPRPLSPPAHPCNVSNDDTEMSYIAAALDFIGADDRDVWFRIGGALHDKFGSAGRTLWDAWSSSSPKFDPKTQDKTWNSFSRQTTRKSSVGFLIAEARRGGFCGTKRGRVA